MSDRPRSRKSQSKSGSKSGSKIQPKSRSIPRNTLWGAIGLVMLLWGVGSWGRTTVDPVSGRSVLASNQLIGNPLNDQFADQFIGRLGDQINDQPNNQPNDQQYLKNQPHQPLTQWLMSTRRSSDRRYSRAALDYFMEVAFGNEFSNNPDTNYIRKWASDLRLAVRGGPTTADRETLDRIVGDLNQLLGGAIRIRFTTQNPNVVIYFVPEADFPKYDPHYVPRNLGFFRVWWTGNLEIQRAQILISTTGVTQRERSHLIREELTQSLGLMNDAETYRDSTFYQGWTETQDFSPLDRDLIQMLYDRRVRSGQTREQIRQLFR